MVILGRNCRLRLLSVVLIPVFLIFTIYKGNWIRNGNWIEKWRGKNSSSSKVTGLNLTQYEQVRRKNHISKICNQYGHNSSWELAALDHFIVDDEHKIIYCYIPKVACTNWKRIFMALKDGKRKNLLDIRGNETHSYPFKTLDSYSKEEIREKLHHYMKFLFVRDPYERLLSAYRNKFEKTYSNYFQDRYGRIIIQQYRKNPKAESLQKGHDVTFSEFLKYVTNLELTHNRVVFNEHWRPMFDLCLPCSVKYDVIGKYKTLEDDADYVLWQAGLSEILSFPRREESYPKERSSELMSTYYRNISKQIIFDLKYIYKYDFMLFEYNASMWD